MNQSWQDRQTEFNRKVRKAQPCLIETASWNLNRRATLCCSAKLIIFWGSNWCFCLLSLFLFSPSLLDSFFLHYFLFLAPLNRQGQWRGAADKTNHVHSRNDIAILYRAPFLLMKNEKTLAGASCVPLTLWKGSRPATIWVGGMRPPYFSSFSIIVLWHWSLPVWLSLSVTLHHLCFPGFANTGTSDWHTKPSNPGNASRECCSTPEGSKSLN